MASRFKKLVKAFGVLDAIKLYSRVKFKPYGIIKAAQYITPFYLRKGTSDYYTFDQVFLRDQYNIIFPFEPKTILDAGANIGLASVYFSHRYPKAKIIAIEPSTENFAVLQKNISGYSNIKAYNKGLWNKDIHLVITNADSVKNAFMVAESTPSNPAAIPAISINTILSENNLEYIDILKVDIEGSEKEVFEFNYENWLPKCRAIVIELHDKMRSGASKSVFKAISQYSFSFDMQDENLIFINEAIK